MNSGDRPEFDVQLSMLCAGYNVPIGDRSEAYWKGLAKMSLMEFSRCVDQALGEGGPDRIPTTGQMWKLLKELRSQRTTTPWRPTETPWHGDGWDTQANRFLLGYIGDQARAGAHYCDEQTRSGARSAEKPSQETRALTAPLVAYKNAWAQDMRDMANERNEVPMDVQKATWADCMRRANLEVQQIRESYAQERMRLVA
jgi:hypothetical protein